MGQVLLVRHGQASWGAADYDVLSATGEQQAEVLGRALRRPRAGRGGPRQHAAAAAHRRDAAVAAAGSDTAPRLDERWNEMDHLAVLAAQPKDFDGRARPAAVPGLVRGRDERGGPPATHDDDYAESFPAFRERWRPGSPSWPGPTPPWSSTSGGPISAVTADLLAAGLETYARLRAGHRQHLAHHASSPGGAG